MSGEASTTDRMVNAVLAAHQPPALSEDFADRVLAAAQTSPTGPSSNKPWPRRTSRPWRRSPLWLGFIALNIVAASAVAAMVSGVPVWHHVTEIAHKVAHIWHKEPVHHLRPRVTPRRIVAPRAPAPAPAAGPTIIASAASAPGPAALRRAETRAILGPLRPHHPRSLAINRPSHPHRPIMLKRQQSERLIRLRPAMLRQTHPRRARRLAFPLAPSRNPRDLPDRAARDRTARLPSRQATAVSREPVPAAVQPPIAYGPRLYAQQALADRQDRARKPQGAWRELRAERRRMRGLDQRMRRSGPRPRRGRFHF